MPLADIDQDQPGQEAQEAQQGKNRTVFTMSLDDGKIPGPTPYPLSSYFQSQPALVEEKKHYYDVIKSVNDFKIVQIGSSPHLTWIANAFGQAKGLTQKLASELQ